MSTLQPQGPPKNGQTNHTEKHPRPQRPTPTNKALSTPSIYQRLEHTKNKHPHIHQCIPPQHTNPRIGQRYAEAAHTDKSRGAKPTGQLQFWWRGYFTCQSESYWQKQPNLLFFEMVKIKPQNAKQKFGSAASRH